MAGPSLDIILSLRKGSIREHVSKKISELVSGYGFGLLNGVESIRQLYEQEGKVLEQLSTEIENPLIISVTDNPKATDAWEIFQRQLHPLHADTEKAKILKFLTDLWSIKEIQSGLFVILRVDTKFLPGYEMTFDEFLKSVASYQVKEHANRDGGGRGIFRIVK